MLLALLHFEWLRESRRPRFHWLRFGYAAILCVEVAFFGLQWFLRAYVQQTPGTQSRDEAILLLVHDYYQLFIWQHFLLVLAVTPVLAGGTVTEEKTRGTLGLVLTSELTAGEYVLSKCLSTLMQILLLSLPVVPLLVLIMALVGLPVATLLLWLSETATLAFVLVSLGLLASVLAATTVRAMTATYATLAAVVILFRLAGIDVSLFRTPVQWDRLAAGASGGSGQSVVVLLAVALGCACLALAAWRLRPAYERFVQGPPLKKQALALLFARPVVGPQPLRWKENHLGHLAGLLFLRRLPRYAKVGLVCLTPLAFVWAADFEPNAALPLCGFLAFAPGLLIGLRSAAAISGEREKTTWDALLTTPLDGRQIVRGKLWGIIDGVRPYMFPLLVVSAACLWYCGGFWLAAAAGVAWVLGWGLLYFQAANGVYWSARSASSWQALLRASGYAGVSFLLRSGLGGVVVFFVAGACITLLAWQSAVFARLVGLFAFLLPVVVSLFGKAEELIQKAEALVDREERVPQKNGAEPVETREEASVVYWPVLVLVISILITIVLALAGVF